MTIPAGYGQWTVVHEGGGVVGEACWTLGFDNNVGATPAEAAEDLWTALEAADYRDYLSSSVTVTEVRCKLGPDVSGPSAAYSVGLDGTIGGQAAPPNLAILMQKNTSLGGRHGRGRWYHGGLAEAQLESDGNIAGATASGIQAMYTGAIAAMVLDNKPPFLLHADATAPTAIESVTAQVRLATQRRRMRR